MPSKAPQFTVLEKAFLSVYFKMVAGFFMLHVHNSFDQKPPFFSCFLQFPKYCTRKLKWNHNTLFFAKIRILTGIIHWYAKFIMGRDRTSWTRWDIYKIWRNCFFRAHFKNTDRSLLSLFGDLLLYDLAWCRDGGIFFGCASMLSSVFGRSAFGLRHHIAC